MPPLVIRVLNLLLRPRNFPYIFTKLFFTTLFYLFVTRVLWPFFTHPLGPSGQLDYVRGLTRPIWDTRPPIPDSYLVDLGGHLDAELQDAVTAGDASLVDWDARCRLNGWRVRNSSDRPRLWDVIHFSNDLEMLEVRLHEMQHVVDVLVLAESTVTYTGRRKKLYWGDGGRDELMKRELSAYNKLERQANLTMARIARNPFNSSLHSELQRFRRKMASHLSPRTFAKIHHLVYKPTDPSFVPNATTTEQAWSNEGLQRQWVYEQVVFGEKKISVGDLMLTADADEIPRASVLWSLKMCTGYPGSGAYIPFELDRRARIPPLSRRRLPPLPAEEPPALHLKLRNSLFSFDHPFRSTMENWNSNIRPFTSYYGSPPVRFHSSSSWIMSQAGWHCSTCLRTLAGIEEKLRAYSHFDRLGTGARRRKILDRTEMQKKLCTGKNFFDMVPEEWDWASLLSHMNGAVRRPGEEIEMDAPRWLVEEVARERMAGRSRLGYLLGGRDCIREDFPGTYEELELRS